MKFMTKALMTALISTMTMTAQAAPSALDLGFDLIHSAEFESYMNSDAAKGLYLKGIEWSAFGESSKGELVEYILKFGRLNRDESGKVLIQSCTQTVMAYHTAGPEGVRKFLRAEILESGLECK